MNQNQLKDCCEGIIKALTGSKEDTPKLYEKYANMYDDIATYAGRNSPAILSKLCLEMINKNSEDSLVLDVATGTGLGARALRNRGFKGMIDGFDGSAEMIEACKNKKIFRNLKVEMLYEDRPLSYPDDTYDAVMCVGCFSMGHIPHSCLKDMMRVLKSGGILVFNGIQLPNDPENKMITSLEETMSQLVDEGKCTLMKKDEVELTAFQKEKKILRHFAFCYEKK